METELTNQIAYAAMFSYAMQKFKLAAWFPWIKKNNALINRIISVSMALITAAGFTWTYHGNFISGGTFIIGIPTAEQLHQFIIHFASSMALQETIYRSGTINIQIPKEVPEPIPAKVVSMGEDKHDYSNSK